MKTWYKYLIGFLGVVGLTIWWFISYNHKEKYVLISKHINNVVDTTYTTNIDQFVKHNDTTYVFYNYRKIVNIVDMSKYNVTQKENIIIVEPKIENN